MYLKIIDKESPAWQALDPFLDSIDESRKACSEYTEKNGGTEYMIPGFYFSGPVVSILAENPPAGWRRDKSEDHGWWTQDMRTKAGKALRKEADEVPRIPTRSICNLMGYDYEQNLGVSESGGFIRSIPGIGKVDDVILINIHEDAKYVPMAGMVEITHSEFRELQNINGEAERG